MLAAGGATANDDFDRTRDYTCVAESCAGSCEDRRFFPVVDINLANTGHVGRGG